MITEIITKEQVVEKLLNETSEVKSSTGGSPDFRALCNYVNNYSTRFYVNHEEAIEKERTVDEIVSMAEVEFLDCVFENVQLTYIKELIENNSEYLVWADNTPITFDDLVEHFHLVKFDNGTWNLGHNTEDYYIEDIIF